MENKHLEHEEHLVKEVLEFGAQKGQESIHPVLVKDWVHSWNPKNSADTTPSFHFSYIKNPTGTIRWFFPSDTPYPTHLGLYNSAHLKARFYKLITHIAFALKMQKFLFSGNFRIEAKNLPFLDILDKLDAETYAVFTGTVGENRKSVIAIYRNKGISHFIKLAHTDQATNLLESERNILRKLSQFPFFRLDHPRVHPASDHAYLILSNIKPSAAREAARMEDLHAEVLAEMYKFSAVRNQNPKSAFFREIHANLSRICTREVQDLSLDNKNLHRLIDALVKVHASLAFDQKIFTTLTHGDFTPWNMYLSENQVHVYDWELASEGKPMLYDFFHFIYQSGILLLRQSHEQIQREIDRSLRLPHSKQILKQYELDATQYHKLYLVSIVSYYLRIYMDEAQVHMQVHWLIDTWKDALEGLCQ